MNDRAPLVAWLVKAWDYAGDNDLGIEDELADLISHAEEPDYPLRVKAKPYISGQGKIPQLLAESCGIPPAGQPESEWERQLNFSPVIYLDESVWRQIHGALGWVNRNHERGLSFWLWSNAGNVIRFVVREGL